MDGTLPEPFDDVLARAQADRFVAGLFAPAALRRSLMALYAFDLEVGRIAGLVREPVAGLIRLAWWREQVTSIYAGGVVATPVGAALAEAIKAHGLPRAIFEDYLDARALEFTEAPMADAARYVAGTSGVIARLAALVLGGGADDAAGLAGLACGYARLSNRVEGERALQALAALSYPRRLLPALAPASVARWTLRHPARALPAWRRVALIAWAHLKGRV
jgi:phytoene/squalene synthetase